MTMTSFRTLASLAVVLTLLGLSACRAAHDGAAPIPALGALPEDAEHVQPRDVNERAPAATLRDVDNRRVNLNIVYREKPTALIFYRGGWCPFCTQHLAELGAFERDLRELGFQIIAVSPDRPDKLRESVGEHELTYTLLSDSDVELIRAFGVAFRVDDETDEMLRGHGIDLEDASGRSHRVLPIPAVYLIDRDGVIRFAHWDANYRERISGEQVLNAAHSMLDNQ